MSVLETKNLSFVYAAGTPFEHTAVKDVNISIRSGEFVGLIGHTGSGKSTLIQHLNGLLQPTSGQVLLDGKDLFSDKKFTRQARFRVGLVFQYPEYQLFEETVCKDIAFGPRNMGLSEDEIHDRVLRAARFVDLDESLLEKSPFDLSGGQKRRAAIAGVIAMEPEILILDEPTAGLDPANRKSLLANIRAFQRERGAAVLMVSHCMEDMAQVAERLIVMDHGGIAMQGPRSEVFSDPLRLEELGLTVPRITLILQRLRDMGLDAGTAFTVPAAADALFALYKEGRHA